uniref:Uncharacterized protein n=1 Tax=Amphora coffeiformis TaxID=265554 RepID=A0A7S3P7M0_9STRA|eukprot:scaffold578_cov167-Amphora_coffeaeformis.AAC.35
MNTTTYDPDKYNPNRIIEAANEKLQQDADWQGGQLMFQTALLQWSDDAREGGDEALCEALATLYMAYAHFLASAKQFKSTMEAYDSAITDPVVGKMGRVWLEYAAFCQERQKFVKAQQVYLRALVGTNGNPPAVPDGPEQEQDRDVLWHAFWEMVKEQNNKPDMTLEELQTAVLSEHQPDAAASATPAFVQSESTITADDQYGDEPAYKKIKLEDGTTLPPPPTHTPTPPPTFTDNKVHVVVPEAVKVQEQAFLEVLQQPDLPPEIRGAWMMVDGTGTAQPPEPPLFQVSPPKLSDPSGKDILGVDLALTLTQQLLETGRGSLALQVCRALWVMTAVHERSAAHRLDRLDADMQQAVAQKEAEFASRRSVAQAAQQQAVEHIIQQERHALQQHVGAERQKLLQEMAWQSRRLLCAQQVILQKLQIPTFEEGPTVDPNRLEWQAKVCSYLHSAFYLRNRIGETTHVSMLQSQCNKLLNEQQKQQQQEKQPPPLPEDTSNAMYNNQPGGFYPPSMPPPPPPPPRYGQPPVYGGGGYHAPYPGMMPTPQQPPQYGGPPPPPPPPGSYPFHR